MVGRLLTREQVELVVPSWLKTVDKEDWGDWVEYGEKGGPKYERLDSVKMTNPSESRSISLYSVVRLENEQKGKSLLSRSIIEEYEKRKNELDILREAMNDSNVSPDGFDPVEFRVYDDIEPFFE